MPNPFENVGNGFDDALKANAAMRAASRRMAGPVDVQATLRSAANLPQEEKPAAQQEGMRSVASQGDPDNLDPGEMEELQRLMKAGNVNDQRMKTLLDKYHGTLR